MFLSVSMPVYNSEQFLNDSIRSIMEQSYSDFELILVNDGSRDRSLEICKGWHTRYPDRVRVINKKMRDLY